MVNAIAAAKTVYSNPNATEAETAKAAGDIDTAVKALIMKKTAPSGKCYKSACQYNR